MHELSLATSMMELLGPKVPERAGLVKVNVTLGPLAGVCADSLSFCFDLIAPQFGFTKAVLEINKIDAEMKCLNCDNKYNTRDMYESCPHCDSFERIVLTGKEFTIDSLELEED